MKWKLAAASNMQMAMPRTPTSSKMRRPNLSTRTKLTMLKMKLVPLTVLLIRVSRETLSTIEEKVTLLRRSRW